MKNDQLKGEIVDYWLKKAEEALESAKDEFSKGRYSFTVNRLYYACFYSASAVLLQKGGKFRKHSGVRSSLHRELVKTGKVDIELGRLYDELFEARQRGDYVEFAEFEQDEVTEWIEKVCRFIEAMKSIANPG